VLDIRVIEERLRRLNKCVGKVQNYSQMTLQDYQEDENVQDIVERNLQLSIQCCIDIGSYIISRQRLKVPDDEENVFVILGENQVISNELAQKVKGMIKFRNILVHDYLEIDSIRVHKIITNGLRDFDQFAKEVIGYL